MGKNYSVVRVAQYTRESIGMAERHIERKNQSYENMNVDSSRSYKNVHFKNCGDLTYNTTLDKMIQDGAVSLRGLKKDAKLFDELIFDVNSAYFEERGGYDFARQFYKEAYRFVREEYGKENILSAVMHADELNTALSEQLGRPVYHYHLHVVALPVVEKEILWSKRCKDPALRGTVKEVIHQISHSKKWASEKVTDEHGHTHLIKSYSLLQDRFFQHMREAGFDGFDRGERGSTAQHLSDLEYKTKKETQRMEQLQDQAFILEDSIQRLSAEEAKKVQRTEAAEKRLEQIIPKVKDLEGQARKYAGSVDNLLPQPDTLESAKSYREQKAKPALKKLQKIYLAVYHAFLELKSSYDALVKEFDRVLRRKTDLEAEIEALQDRNRSLSVAADKYNTLCRGYGQESIDAHVQEIREKERQERERRYNIRRQRDPGAR